MNSVRALGFLTLLVSCSNAVVPLQSKVQEQARLQGTYAGTYGFSVIDHQSAQESLRVLGKVTLMLDSQSKDECSAQVTGQLKIENYDELNIQEGHLSCDFQENNTESGLKKQTLEIWARNSKNNYQLTARVVDHRIENARLKITYQDPQIDIIRDFGMQVARIH